MKIITFWGGLGNQIFEYAYYLWLKEKYPSEKIYGYYSSIGLSDHNGLEINKRFDVLLPPTSPFITLIGNILFNVNRLLRRVNLPLMCTCTQANGRYSSFFHCDYWQDKKYILDSFHLNYQIVNLEKNNEDVLQIINNNNAVAIHIRRGDYMTAGNVSTYGGICTEEYYSKAIACIEKKEKELYYIFFSDDPNYVKQHYSLNNMIVVDWNKGEKSIFDMYLMSQCKYMILANSTFSFWAAKFNRKAKIICCPERWANVKEPDIILDNWIKIKSY